MCVCSVDINSEAVVLSSGGVVVSGNKRNKKVDTNHFQVLTTFRFSLPYPCG